MSTWRVRAGAGLTLVACTALLYAASSDRQDDVARLNAATQVFQQIMNTPDKGIPTEILEGAQCIAIIPGEKKAAFGFGGNYGKGVALCRQVSTVAGQPANWGPPLFVTIGGGSWGLQLGVQSSDVVLVFPDRNQLDSLLSSKFRIGAEAAAAAGPVGRHVSAATDAKLNSEILTYGRSKGAFAGISISGAVVQPDTTGNQAMYGQDNGTNSQKILSGRGVAVPAAAEPLIKELNRNAATGAAPGH